jgi:hypothetical protein
LRAFPLPTPVEQILDQNGPFCNEYARRRPGANPA